MATDDAPADLDSFEEPTVDNDNSEGIDLEPGDHYIGQITGFKPWVGDYGLLLIDGEPVYLNQTLRDQLVSGCVVGSQIMYAKSEDEESFTDGDGEEVTYNPRSFRFQGDD
ncbi:hypothetical protein ACFR9U_04225 [Halorientalis brevis]|uniref:Uncharacterized protein n=1 Tax=Halorientalis brevis TaxID=1126241 RepID=A0ABD6C8I2_9EURY|nr:hypothetical protein [Halorientalis brevis]